MFISLNPGEGVMCDGQRYRVSRPLDFAHVLAHNLATGEIEQLSIQKLQPLASVSLKQAPEAVASGPDLVQIRPKERWEEANERYEVIRALLDRGVATRQAVKQHAIEIGIHPATIYRWLRAYRQRGEVAALLKERPGPRRGQQRLQKEVETVVTATIQSEYGRAERPSAAHVAREVMRRCHCAGLTPPHMNTIRRRIEPFKPRREAQESPTRHTPAVGEFPGADFPLAVVQIDHTKLDVILVDDLGRRPVGRPWITLAMDVFSRMIAGFYVSFDPPGDISVGLCLAHAILPKELWLARFGISTPWPVWGFMHSVHADNAKEFHGEMLKQACHNHAIDLRWRFIERPWYGGHIERLLGTVLSEIHTLPGTTFSNPAEKGAYDSEGRSALTLAEFEKWLTHYVVDIYHQRPHSALGMAPLKKYEQGTFGDGTNAGRGLPRRCTDETKLRLDLMPYLERTVQRTGLMIDEIHYYADVLRPWICAKDPDDTRRKRKFAVRRDPRDISVVYFYDPEIDQYFRIPYRDTSRPAISVWELREVRRRLREEGREAADENLIFDAYTRMRTIEEQAVRETKAARRNDQRRRLHASVEKPLEPPTVKRQRKVEPLLPAEQVQPFDEIEELS